MRLITTIAALKEARRALAGTLGLVPTMGYLHEGHLTLVRRAKAENTFVAASIYVNPLQFGPREDFRQYPRDLPRDLHMLEQAGTDLVFAPTDGEMYPPGYNTYVEIQGITDKLEGASRPGHFKGVATVVAKLFNILEPTRAYFGQKDAQQVAVIKRMVADLNMNLDIVVVPTVREPDGLAMSSRNTYLNPPEREAAVVLWRALGKARELWDQGVRSGQRLRREMAELIRQEPLARLDYVSVADPMTLEELEEAPGPALASLAVWVGKTRLIDNVTLGP